MFNSSFHQKEEESDKKIVKILVVGCNKAGTSCILNRYELNSFTDIIQTPIHPRFFLKKLQVSECEINLQIINISNKEIGSSVLKAYYHRINGAIIVIDLSHINESLDMAIKWKKDIEKSKFNSNNKYIPCILAGNKVDLVLNDNLQQIEELMKQFSDENNFIDYFSVSAKTGFNIDEMFYSLASYITDNQIDSYSNVIEVRHHFINISSHMFLFCFF